MSDIESRAIHDFNRRLVQEFMDVIILKELKNNQLLSGYDVVKYLYGKFHMLPSPGTVYSILYSLERQSLIKGNMNQGKRTYELTSQGESFLRNIDGAKNGIQAFLSVIF